MSEYDLSIVVVTRNDNHGLNLNERTNRFLDSCDYMSQKHKVFIELIIVEWNPPSENESLSELFSKRLKRNNYLDIKIITVPNELHNKFENSKNLHLYQMIGKNVGIKRANAKFVLATNIDIIFNDGFFIKIKKGLKEKTLYRCYRLDVPQDYAFIESPIELLQKCKQNFHTINSRFGTFIFKNKFIRFLLNHSMTFNMRLRFLIIYCACQTFLIFIFKMICSPFTFIAMHIAIASKKFAIITKSINFIEKKIKGTVFKNFFLNFKVKLKKSNLDFKVKVKNFYLDFKVKVKNFYLFTNACGDFTLLDKNSWLKINGYLEWPIYSLHIDSFLLFQAYYNELNFKNLASVVTFHIDHSIGSGFSLKGEKILLDKLAQRSIPVLSFDEYKKTVINIKNNKIKFNKNWGLSNKKLKVNYL